MTGGACHLRIGQIAGWQAVTLANDRLEITVVPDKGADIVRFVEVRRGINVLGSTHYGLSPPDAPPNPGSDDNRFLQNYEGGWQELFPNCLTACSYDGREIPFHGEVATLPWTWRELDTGPDEVRIALVVDCKTLPFTLERVMTLAGDDACLTIEETIFNRSHERLPFVWGHHPLLGPPFIEAGCRIHAVPGIALTAAVAAEPATSTLAQGRRFTWPHSADRDGGAYDLSEIPGPEFGGHDHAYLTGFEQGSVEVVNPRLELGFRLEWDPAIFRWLINWRPLGGSNIPPLDGIYGLAIEPWSARANLSTAIREGEAHWLDGRTSLKTVLRASLVGRKSIHLQSEN